MELFDITESQLIDIFMVEFPSTMSIEECREKLELEIYMKAIEFGLDPDDEESSVRISPMWVWIALAAMERRKRGDKIDPETAKRFGITENRKGKQC